MEWSRGEREAQDGVDIWILIAELPVLYSSFSLATYFTHGKVYIYISMLLSQFNHLLIFNMTVFGNG